MIKGIPVTLYERTKTGEDALGEPVYRESASETVENVLVAPVSSTEMVDELNLSGRRIVYTLAIPKGDTHEWDGHKVRFFNETFRVISAPTMGIDALIPLDWNKKVTVERIG